MISDANGGSITSKSSNCGDNKLEVSRRLFVVVLVYFAQLIMYCMYHRNNGHTIVQIQLECFDVIHCTL